jgi:CheY-like chemotaxis protein
MGTRIIQFGVLPDGVLAALIENGYELDACGTSIPKLTRALEQHNDVHAIAVAESGASKAKRILTTVHSVGKVPLILFQDESGTCDPSHFDLVIPEHAPLPELLERMASAIERNRAIRANSEVLREQQVFLRGRMISLREQTAALTVDSQRIRGKRQRSVTERVSISSVLVVDDHARWRDTVCSMVKDYADCGLLREAEDGIEAVERATELKPQLILLDLDLPRLNGIDAANQITRSSPDSIILFLSMDNCPEVVCQALSTGAKGYVLKTDAGSELWPAIETVLQNKQYLSRGLRGLHSATIN